MAWKIRKELLEREGTEDKTPFYIDLAVKSVALIALGFLFVKGANRLLVPNVNLMDLLSKTAIPKNTIQVIAEESMDNLVAFWAKPFLENLNTGLFFIRTILDVYLAYITKQSTQKDKTARYQLLLNALIHAVTTCKTAQYRTIHIKHTFDYLFQEISYYNNVEPIYRELSEKYFAVPIKKVETTFEVNTSGLTTEALIRKIESIYDYSINIFEESRWYRYFLGFNGMKKNILSTYCPHWINQTGFLKIPSAQLSLFMGLLSRKIYHHPYQLEYVFFIHTPFHNPTNALIYSD
ncbi:MAG: hypothetical protein LVR00_01490 [Rhabdochlamydiaceae bacterium]